MLSKLKNYFKKRPKKAEILEAPVARGPFEKGKYPNSWPTLQDYLKKHAEKSGVTSDVHEEDFLFRYVLEHPVFKSDEAAIENYFEDGAESAKKISKVLADLGIKPHSKKSMLEFASGYGMVTRHLVKELAPMRIVSCDIHEQAMNFLDSKIGVETLLSESIPENLKIDETFDVVFALSFFSHMPDATFGRWLKTLYNGVKQKGYLIFTTHGQATAALNKIEIPESGIFFSANSEQKDLDLSEYGSSMVTSKYVHQQVKKHLNTIVLSEKEAAWWGHQDLYIIQKT